MVCRMHPSDVVRHVISYGKSIICRTTKYTNVLRWECYYALQYVPMVTRLHTSICKIFTWTIHDVFNVCNKKVMSRYQVTLLNDKNCPIIWCFNLSRDIM